MQKNQDWQIFHKDISVHVEQLLHKTVSALPNHDAPLKDAMHYSLMAGGKRIRPFLVYATGALFDLPRKQLDPLAMAIEAIHTYSLIHDDLPAMDDDDLRRGKATCHIAFDEATAILAGDALQTLAFDVVAHNDALSPEHRIKVIQILSRASGYHGMCGGQAIDLAYTEKQTSLATLENLHHLKTGALIRASVEMPCALLTEISAEVLHSLVAYATTIGLAFQVQDDILDVTSSTEQLGKPQGSDKDGLKCTYPDLLGLDEAHDYLAKLFEQALHALDAIPYNTLILQSFTQYLAERRH
ncbi:MAG: (2E,6E)-farnesyl diphosphate synthase [Aestuariibacter sp.]